MEEKILIVEDEEKLARFVELELVHEGYRVEKAMDGRDALEMAERGDYGLILLDVMLPGMSGMELLRRLRRTKQTPVIMVTARDAVMDKVTGLDMGADDYITKPLRSRNCWPASARRCASAPRRWRRGRACSPPANSRSTRAATPCATARRKSPSPAASSTFCRR